MKMPTILPPVGEPVSTALLNLDVLDSASVGEILHASTLLARAASERLADPQTYHEVATFADAEGADWSGFQGTDQQSVNEGESLPDSDHSATTNTPPAPPVPDNYCDTCAGMLV